MIEVIIRLFMSYKALITGSSTGIGLGIAKALLEEGCDVIINGRN